MVLEGWSEDVYSGCRPEGRVSPLGCSILNLPLQTVGSPLRVPHPKHTEMKLKTCHMMAYISYGCGLTGQTLMVIFQVFCLVVCRYPWLSILY